LPFPSDAALFNQGHPSGTSFRPNADGQQHAHSLVPNLCQEDHNHDSVNFAEEEAEEEGEFLKMEENPLCDL
jgi:hypothetical protein